MCEECACVSEGSAALVTIQDRSRVHHSSTDSEAGRYEYCELTNGSYIYLCNDGTCDLSRIDRRNNWDYDLEELRTELRSRLF